MVGEGAVRVMVYLSAEYPRWEPKAEADLRAAIEDGRLAESHYLDAKREPATGKSANKEAAQDMAAFAVDGGTLIIGVGEDKDQQTFYLAPQPLAGAAEKMENLARHLVDPPLSVFTTYLPSEDQPGAGYLLVHVPPSPLAPHMVGGRYYGRAGTTKYSLSDPEVARLHLLRQGRDADVLAMIRAQIDRDPVPREHRHNAHLFLLAHPLTARAQMLLDLVTGPGWTQRLEALVDRGRTPELNQLLTNVQFEPSLGWLHERVRRARGVALTTSNLEEGRVYRPESGDLEHEKVMELEVDEDGGLRLYCTRLSDTMNSRGEVFFDAGVVDHTRRFLALVQAASEHAAYLGPWSLAVGVTGIKGIPAYRHGIAFGPGAHSRFDEDDYTATTTASWADLTKNPGTTTNRLVGRLARALGTDGNYDTLLSDSAATD